MANRYTGEFDVVAQVSVEGVDRVLAAQHQVTHPRQIYLHSFWASVPPRGADDGTGIRGAAATQVSTPTVTLPSGSTGSRVTIHFQVMVHMQLRAGSAAAPEFVHGEIQATLDADQVTSTAEDILTIDLSGDDVEVTFIPASGTVLSPEEFDRVNRAIDTYLRAGFEPVNLRVSLPSGGAFPVRHWSFKTLPGGTPAAVALLLLLRDVAPEGVDRASVDEVFLAGDDDLAVAIGSDFLVPLLEERAEEELRRYLGGLRITIDRRFISDCTYRVQLRDVTVELVRGRVRVTVRARAPGSGFICPDYGITIRQDFLLRAAGDRVILDADGDPEVDLSGFGSIFIESRVTDEVRRAQSEILAWARPAVEDMLNGFSSFIDDLRAPALHMAYRSVDIRPEGVIVHGEVTVDPWSDVMLTYETRTLPPAPPERPEPQLEMDAFKSWIPGGTIERYRWIYGDPRAPVREIVEEHRFLTRVPPLVADPSCVWPPCQWCVEIQGQRDGRDVRWWTCELIGDGIVRLPPEVIVPDVRLPVGVPGVDGGLIAHLDPWGGGEGRTGMARGSGANLLVHFAGANSQETVPVLREALKKWSQGEVWVQTIVVVEPGTAGEQPVQDGRTPLAWAEDFEGGWQKAFGVQKSPAFYLVNPRGEMAWQHAGELEADALRKALDEHLEKGEPLRYGRFRTGVEVGEAVPDFLFDYAPQRPVALRTFQGEPVTLVFWTTWSAPSLAELQRLGAEQGQGSRPGLVLAVNDGEDPQQAREVFEQHGFPFHFVADPERRIARRFGVACWPTVIRVGRGGRVLHIRQGLSPVSRG